MHNIKFTHIDPSEDWPLAPGKCSNNIMIFITNNVNKIVPKKKIFFLAVKTPLKDICSSSSY